MLLKNFKQKILNKKYKNHLIKQNYYTYCKVPLLTY